MICHPHPILHDVPHQFHRRVPVLSFEDLEVGRTIDELVAMAPLPMSGSTYPSPCARRGLAVRAARARRSVCRRGSPASSPRSPCCPRLLAAGVRFTAAARPRGRSRHRPCCPRRGRDAVRRLRGMVPTAGSPRLPGDGRRDAAALTAGPRACCGSTSARAHSPRDVRSWRCSLVCLC